jgi:PhnB protein
MRLTPFLLFEGNCAEAMTFYQRQLGGTLILAMLSDTPMKDHMPETLTKAYAKLESGDIAFSATLAASHPGGETGQHRGPRRGRGHLRRVARDI